MTRFVPILLLSTAALSAPIAAEAASLMACVNSHSGEIKAVKPGTQCRRGSYLVELATGSGNPPPPPPSTLTVEYVTGGMYPGTSVSRAFCPPGSIVAGGGGITMLGADHALQQSHPISDLTGLIAWGPNAIGWQVATDDWSDSQAFVVCLRP